MEIPLFVVLFGGFFEYLSGNSSILVCTHCLLPLLGSLQYLPVSVVLGAKHQAQHPDVASPVRSREEGSLPRPAGSSPPQAAQPLSRSCAHTAACSQLVFCQQSGKTRLRCWKPVCVRVSHLGDPGCAWDRDPLVALRGIKRGEAGR